MRSSSFTGEIKRPDQAIAGTAAHFVPNQKTTSIKKGVLVEEDRRQSPVNEEQLELRSESFTAQHRTTKLQDVLEPALRQEVYTNPRLTPEFENKVVIYGGGAYATVIANLLAAGGYDVKVLMTSRDSQTPLEKLEARAQDFNAENGQLHEGRAGAGRVHATADIKEAFEDRGIVVYAAPTSGLNRFADSVKVSKGTQVISVAKGLCIAGWDPKDNAELLAGPQDTSNMTVYTPLNKLKNHPNFENAESFAVIAGPGFAKEIMRGTIFGLTIGSTSKKLLSKLYKMILKSNRDGNNQIADVQVDLSPDPTSVEIMAAMKNVTAIACGIAYGLANDDLNAKMMDSTLQPIFPVISQGVREAVHVSKFTAASPMKHRYLLNNIHGDFALSSTPHSRNARFGSCLAHGLLNGQSPVEVLDQLDMTVEGIQGAHAAKLMTDPREGRHGLRVDLVNAVVDVLQGKAYPQRILDVCTRKSETVTLVDGDDAHLELVDPKAQYNTKIWTHNINDAALDSIEDSMRTKRVPVFKEDEFEDYDEQGSFEPESELSEGENSTGHKPVGQFQKLLNMFKPQRFLSALRYLREADI